MSKNALKSKDMENASRPLVEFCGNLKFALRQTIVAARFYRGGKL